MPLLFGNKYKWTHEDNEIALAERRASWLLKQNGGRVDDKNIQAILASLAAKLHNNYHMHVDPHNGDYFVQIERCGGIPQ